MMRSAKMNDTTPPKLIPPFHSTAANGTFPIEHTKLSHAHDGAESVAPYLGQDRMAGEEEVLPEVHRHPRGQCPATSRPITISRSTDAHSMTKMCEIDVSASFDRNRRQSPPGAWMLMSIAACPSMLPASPLPA